MMAKKFSLNLVCVQGHSNILGNEKANELARMDTFAVMEDFRHAALHLYAQCNGVIHNSRWSSIHTCNVVNTIWSEWNRRRSIDLIELKERRIL